MTDPATRMHLAASRVEEAVVALQNLLEPPPSDEGLRAENTRLLSLLRRFPPPRPAMLPARRLKLAARQQWRCAHCGEMLSEAFHADHRLPWSTSFNDDDENIDVLCVPCHQGKTSEEASVRNRK